jgi:hypothetical protein
MLGLEWARMVPCQCTFWRCQLHFEIDDPSISEPAGTQASTSLSTNQTKQKKSLTQKVSHKQTHNEHNEDKTLSLRKREVSRSRYERGEQKMTKGQKKKKK